MEVRMKRFKGDKWMRFYGSPIPVRALLLVRRYFPRRRALVIYEGREYLTFVWCLGPV